MNYELFVLIMLIAWSFMFVIEIASAATGRKASWVLTICPTLCLVVIFLVEAIK